MQMTGQRIMYDLRMAIYGHLQKLDLQYYDRNPVGRLMTRVTSDVDVLNDLFTSGVVTIFGDVFTLAGIMVVMLAMNWRLALVAFSVLPLIFFITQWFRRHVRESYRVVRTWIARINAFMQENIRDVDRAAVPARGAELRALRRHRQEAQGREHRVYFLLLRLLSGDRGRQRARLGADHLVRRRQRPAQRADGRRARGLSAVFTAFLPADQRHVGEVQRSAVGDGLVGADFQTAR
jgi:ABC-type multidrug transport system fused ATPase/permease subunit